MVKQYGMDWTPGIDSRFVIILNEKYAQTKSNKYEWGCPVSSLWYFNPLLAHYYD